MRSKIWKDRVGDCIETILDRLDVMDGLLLGGLCGFLVVYLITDRLSIPWVSFCGVTFLSKKILAIYRR